MRIIYPKPIVYTATANAEITEIEGFKKGDYISSQRNIGQIIYLGFEHGIIVEYLDGKKDALKPDMLKKISKKRWQRARAKHLARIL